MAHTQVNWPGSEAANKCKAEGSVAAAADADAPVSPTRRSNEVEVKVIDFGLAVLGTYCLLGLHPGVGFKNRCFSTEGL